MPQAIDGNKPFDGSQTANFRMDGKDVDPNLGVDTVKGIPAVGVSEDEHDAPTSAIVKDASPYATSYVATSELGSTIVIHGLDDPKRRKSIQAAYHRLGSQCEKLGALGATLWSCKDGQLIVVGWYTDLPEVESDGRDNLTAIYQDINGIPIPSCLPTKDNPIRVCQLAAMAPSLREDVSFPGIRYQDITSAIQGLYVPSTDELAPELRGSQSNLQRKNQSQVILRYESPYPNVGTLILMYVFEGRVTESLGKDVLRKAYRLFDDVRSGVPIPNPKFDDTSIFDKDEDSPSTTSGSLASQAVEALKVIALEAIKSGDLPRR
jgi:hypothetical protein